MSLSSARRAWCERLGDSGRKARSMLTNEVVDDQVVGGRVGRSFLTDLILRTLFPLLGLAGVWVASQHPWLSLAAAAMWFLSLRRLEERFGRANPLPLVRLQRRTWVMAHPEDLHVLAFMLVYWAGLISALWISVGDVRAELPMSERVGFCLAAAWWLGLAGGVNTGINYHSHAHRGIFKHRLLNRWVGRIWTIPGGFPAYFWSYKHLVVHHRHLHEERDWVQPRRRTDGRYENLYRYALTHWPWRWAGSFYRDFSQALPRVRRRARRELAFFLVCWSLPFFIDAWFGVGIWLLHQWIGNALVMGPGMYAQHACGTNEQPFSHSNTFLCAFFNMTTFNAGFHIEHTEHPGVHWSELPALHEEMKEELIAGGGHVVAYGIFTGAGLLSAMNDGEAGMREFEKQAPGYQPAARSAPES